MHKLYKVRRRTIWQASLFGAGLGMVVIVSFCALFLNMPQVILGTEMNTNGMVEYLCLGSGCEYLTPMDY